MPRTTIGYVLGESGRFDRAPFFRLRLSLESCRKLDELLNRAGAEMRRTTTLSASFHQPDRLRVTEIEAPEYERRASAFYVRGDAVRVQGREGVSCGLDLSAKFGVPLIRKQLAAAAAVAKDYVELRVPSRKRDIVELIPDLDMKASEEDALVAGSVTATLTTLPPEDFSDWET